MTIIIIIIIALVPIVVAVYDSIVSRQFAAPDLITSHKSRHVRAFVLARAGVHSLEPQLFTSNLAISENKFGPSLLCVSPKLE